MNQQLFCACVSGHIAAWEQLGVCDTAGIILVSSWPSRPNSEQMFNTPNNLKANGGDSGYSSRWAT